MYELPTSVTVDGKQMPIRNKGDYRVMLDCFAALEDGELSKEERIIAAMVIFYDGFEGPEDVQTLGDAGEAFGQMAWFFNCGRETDGERHDYKLIDWAADETLICSAINKVAGREVRSEPYVHWWTFMGWYAAIGECALSNIVGIRYKLARNRKLEKYERRFMQDNPQYFKNGTMTAEQRDADNYVRNLWKNGGKAANG